MSEFDETPPQVPAGPLETAVDRGYVEIGVMPGTPAAETMVDALVTAEDAYQDRLAESIDQGEQLRLRARILVSGDLRAKLRGRDPYEMDTRTGAFRKFLASQETTEQSTSDIPDDIPEKLGSVGLFSVERPPAPSTAERRTKPSHPKQPVTLRGGEVVCLLDAMNIAPFFLDDRVREMQESGPPAPVNIPVIHPNDETEVREKKEQQRTILVGEVTQAWEREIDQIGERALAIRNLYEAL
jgi:hypothetical protein